MTKKSKSLSDLDTLLSDDQKENLRKHQEKEEYQKAWRDNKSKFRKMVAKKNIKWLNENSENPEFKQYDRQDAIYEIISNMFDDESKRKWMIHVICNFLPLNKAKQVPKLPEGQNVCPYSGYMLTDTNSILTGDRNKHIAFTGENTNILISGVALQEINRFVLNSCENFDSREGQIINYALDKLRQQS